MVFHYAKPGKSLDLCNVRGCIKVKGEHEGNGERRLCPMHRSRKRRFDHPIKAAFYDLQGNAKKRGKEFKLTFEEYREFVLKHGYMELRGRKNECLQIDRIRDNEGYHKDNIQVLTGLENKKKQHYDREYYRSGKHLRDAEVEDEPPENVVEPGQPF